MKKILSIILSALLLCSCSEQAGSGNTPDESTTTETEVTTETEATAIADEPLSEITDAERIYNLLMDNIDEWWYEEVTEYTTLTLQGGTLIDLDFDGTPEFLTMKMFGDKLFAYKLNGDKVEELYNFGQIDYDVVDKIVTGMTTYTDENGKKSWAMYYNKDNDFYFSLFDFTGGEVRETVKFMEAAPRRKDINNDINNDNVDTAEVPALPYYNEDNYYGLPHANSEFYIDGERFYAPEEETAAFNAERNKAVAEYEAKFAEGLDGYDNMLPWGCTPYYAYPDIEHWRAIKAEFLAKLDRPAYKLIPNSDNYWSNDDAWNDKDKVGESIKKLVDAYYNKDEAYLRSEYLFQESEGAMCKPVIYLYPEDTTDLNVQITFPNGGDFTCTYPNYDYNNGWNVTAYPDGTLINKVDGLEYSYLYWEGKGTANWDFSSGFVVKGKDTAEFLREKLSYLGLKPREYNEFIVYWLPLMQGNEYNLITFQSTAYEESAALNISPEPDSVLRVFMAYMPLENYIYITEQKLETFERTGFSMIEWGGTCVKGKE